MNCTSEDRLRKVNDEPTERRVMKVAHRRKSELLSSQSKVEIVCVKDNKRSMTQIVLQLINREPLSGGLNVVGSMNTWNTCNVTYTCMVNVFTLGVSLRFTREVILKVTKILSGHSKSIQRGANPVRI